MLTDSGLDEETIRGAVNPLKLTDTCRPAFQWTEGGTFFYMDQRLTRHVSTFRGNKTHSPT